MYTHFADGHVRKRQSYTNQFYWDWMDGANSRWYPMIPYINNSAMTTGAIAANVAQQMIFKAPNRDVTLSGLAIEVTTPQAAALVNIAVYEINQDAFNTQTDVPFVSGKLLCEVDALDCSANGVKSGSVSVTLKKNLPYMLTILTGGYAGTISLRAVSGTLQGVGLASFGTTTAAWPWWGATSLTYQNPMPDCWPWTAGLSVNFVMPGRGVTASNPTLVFGTFV